MADDSNTAQAEKLVAALREQVRDMSSKLVTVEREGIGSGTSRARALRIQAAELRRDLDHARFLLERLDRRFPGVGAHSWPG